MVLDFDVKKPLTVQEFLNNPNNLIFNDKDFIQKQADAKFLNIPISFDTETTSFYNNNEKCAIMYVWQMCILNQVIIGRTWDEFVDLLNLITKANDLSLEKRIIIYVHNLSFDFQFLRKHFVFKKLFAIDKRSPLYAVTDGGIEFRCSYLLSGYSLEDVAKNLTKHKIRKLKGDLDYSLMRHSKTVLTPQELEYCYNDVRIVCAYIQELIDENGNITKLPYTKTGFVRNYCRNNCYYADNSHRGKENVIKRNSYHKLINSLWLEPEEYKSLKQAFIGGFTHASHIHSNKLLTDVHSFDFTSSYPAVMMYNEFPMGKGRFIDNVNNAQFNYYISHYCCLIILKFNNLIIKDDMDFEHPLSKSKIIDPKHCFEDNGRIVECEEGYLIITEQDFYTYSEFYDFDYEVLGLWTYPKAFLPKDLIMSILKLYSDKTTLKDVKEKVNEYQNKKGMLNACYGMCVTDIVRETILYNFDWTSEPADIETQIKKYNNDKRRFLSYPWGIWITAYARRNLFDGIKALRYDYVYSDTDSVKFLNYEQHLDYFNKYNEDLKNKLLEVSERRNIPFELFEPTTIKGVKKLIGVWDDDGHYKKFKTLGAKRYLVQFNDGTYKLTCAGVNSKTAMKYLETFDNPFDKFENNLIIPAEYTGKSTHTYIDNKITGTLVDYNGVACEYEELSYIHLEPTAFSINMQDTYIDYIFNGKEIKEK